jgi:folate-binding Fe-S cluster repair protein YgfZ
MSVPDNEIVVTMEDIRDTLFCARSARPWFRLHGIDFDSFLDGKITADILLATGDGLAIQVVETARKRAL